MNPHHPRTVNLRPAIRRPSPLLSIMAAPASRLCVTLSRPIKQRRSWTHNEDSPRQTKRITRCLLRGCLVRLIPPVPLPSCWLPVRTRGLHCTSRFFVQLTSRQRIARFLARSNPWSFTGKYAIRVLPCSYHSATKRFRWAWKRTPVTLGNALCNAL